MFDRVANLPFMDLQSQWPVKDLGDGYREAVQSNLPALLFSGSLDVNTPSHQAESVLIGFPNGTHITVENAGHEQIEYHGMTRRTIVDFSS